MRQPASVAIHIDLARGDATIKDFNIMEDNWADEASSATVDGAMALSWAEVSV